MYLIEQSEPAGKLLEPTARSLTPRDRTRAQLDPDHRRALILLEELGLEPAADLELSQHYMDPGYARDRNFYLMVSATEICVGMMDGYSVDQTPELNSEWDFCGSGPVTIHLRSRRPDRPKSRAPLSGSIASPLHAFLILPKVHQVPTGHLHRFLSGVETVRTQVESPWLIDLLGDHRGSSYIEAISVHHWRIRDFFYEEVSLPERTT